MYRLQEHRIKSSQTKRKRPLGGYQTYLWTGCSSKKRNMEVKGSGDRVERLRIKAGLPIARPVAPVGTLLLDQHPIISHLYKITIHSES